MTRVLGIVTEDPLIATAIYQRMIEKINGLHNPSLHPDVMLYARKVPGKLSFRYYEGTVAMRSLDVGHTVFPDLDLTGLEQAPRACNILVPPKEWIIKPYEVEKLRRNILTQTPPSGPLRQRYNSVTKAIDLWAEALLSVGQSAEPSPFTAWNGKLRTGQQENIRARNPARHPQGFIAVQGGMGPEAGNYTFQYLAERHKGALLLGSAYVHPAMDFILMRETTIQLKNPFPRVRALRERMSALKPDVTFMACNTMHVGHELLTKGLKTPQLHIIDEGMRQLKPNARVLVLATRASVQSGLFQESRVRTGREDVTLVFPTPEEQASINEAIETYILSHGDYRPAGVAFDRIIRQHLNDADIVMAGCTEVILGLAKGKTQPLLEVVDNAFKAADKALQLIDNKIDVNQPYSNKNRWDDSGHGR